MLAPRNLTLTQTQGLQRAVPGHHWPASRAHTERSRAGIRAMKPERPGLDVLDREHAVVPGVSSKLLMQAILILMLPSGAGSHRGAKWSRDEEALLCREAEPYVAIGDPNQLPSASARPSSVARPTQATYPSGRTSTAVGALTYANDRKLPLALVARVDQPDPIRPAGDVDAWQARRD